MKEKLRAWWGRLDPLAVWSANVLLVSLLLTLTRYKKILGRTWAGMKDVGAAASNWFLRVRERLSEKGTEAPGASAPSEPSSPEALPGFQLPQVNLEDFLGFSLEDILIRFSSFWDNFFDLYNFLSFQIWLIDTLYNLSMILLLVLPIFLILGLLVSDNIMTDKEKSMGSGSRPYRAYLRLAKGYGIPALRGAASFAKYLYGIGWLRYLIVGIWILNLNLITLGCEALAFYFSLIVNFDLTTIFTYFFKLLFDVLIMLSCAPLWFWIAAFGAILFYAMIRKAYDNLNHMESKNCGFIKSIDMVILVIGAMGTGKTQLITDMAVSTVNIHKQDTLDIMLEREFLFPGFPWVCFRDDVLMRTVRGEFFTLFAIDYHVNSLQDAYEKGKFNLYGYDTGLYAMEKSLGNRTVTLWEMMKEYGRAYRVYLQENPSVSNYPIRFDGQFDSSVYFPRWDGDFFKLSPKEAKARSRYSHILDQDIMRLGKKVKPDNPLAGTFGYGIYSNTEWGKCRGNQLTNADKDIKDKLANAKNDLYSYSLKMVRHNGCTIAGTSFFKFFGDEQRVMSLAQDQRDLCTVIEILERSEQKLCLPHGELIDKIYKAIFKRCRDFYFSYANARGDTILTVQFLKDAVSLLVWGYLWLYGTFGYRVQKLQVESGTTYGVGGPSSGEKDVREYYLMNKKGFRYLTDCYTGFFEKAQLDAGLGLDDYPTYNSKNMTYEEMELQRDYFLMDMMKRMVGEAESFEDEQYHVRTKKGRRESDDFDFEFPSF